MPIFDGFNKLRIASVLLNRATGYIPSYCIKCKKPETVKLLDDDKSHSYKCDCGITIYRYHEPDQFHKEPFFVKSHISAAEYKKNFVLEKEMQKNGFKKEGNAFVK